ncbi:hypothetical protein PPACK8108_LOCUS21043 [Phakopsora pachyrhizi]|uniref:Uncharacterized protein n=1 Tax=Phakopsora pachyrhizi TaxID=170000 RepID=A0AAV0BIJ8_PHAPC|nr:hypothetical protein PPACK8108_LOCUS21043 [Phakopsora pachyrhizi]
MPIEETPVYQTEFGQNNHNIKNQKQNRLREMFKTFDRSLQAPMDFVYQSSKPQKSVDHHYQSSSSSLPQIKPLRLIDLIGNQLISNHSSSSSCQVESMDWKPSPKTSVVENSCSDKDCRCDDQYQEESDFVSENIHKSTITHLTCAALTQSVVAIRDIQQPISQIHPEKVLDKVIVSGPQSLLVPLKGTHPCLIRHQFHFQNQRARYPQFPPLPIHWQSFDQGVTIVGAGGTNSPQFEKLVKIKACLDIAAIPDCPEASLPRLLN